MVSVATKQTYCEPRFNLVYDCTFKYKDTDVVERGNGG